MLYKTWQPDDESAGAEATESLRPGASSAGALDTGMPSRHRRRVRRFFVSQSYRLIRRADGVDPDPWAALNQVGTGCRRKMSHRNLSRNE